MPGPVLCERRGEVLRQREAKVVLTHIPCLEAELCLCPVRNRVNDAVLWVQHLHTAAVLVGCSYARQFKQ